MNALETEPAADAAIHGRAEPLRRYLLVVAGNDYSAFTPGRVTYLS